MGSGLGCPWHLHSSSLMALSPFPRRVLGSVPGLIVDERSYSRSPSARFVPSLGGSRLHPRFVPVAAGGHRPRPGVGAPVYLPAGSLPEKAEGPSRFLENPVSVPVLDPEGIAYASHAAAATRLRCVNDVAPAMM